MIYIFHGDDEFHSRQAFSTIIDSLKSAETLKLDHKEFNLEKINLFLNSPSLFSLEKTLILTNFFSLTKANLDAFFKICKNQDNLNLIIWQDKSLKTSDLKLLPKAQINHYPLPKLLFSCLNALKPNNHRQFIDLYLQVVDSEPFELFYFWVKNHLRKNLTSYSSIPADKLKNHYLQLIELENDLKTGKNQQPKEQALLSLLINLIS